jgi:hypothetical protein
MSRTFLDENLLTWEAYPSGGPFGFSDRPFIVFNCLSNRMLRPRYVSTVGDEADAERTVELASDEQLLEMFNRSQEVS